MGSWSDEPRDGISELLSTRTNFEVSILDGVADHLHYESQEWLNVWRSDLSGAPHVNATLELQALAKEVYDLDTIAILGFREKTHTMKTSSQGVYLGIPLMGKSSNQTFAQWASARVSNFNRTVRSSFDKETRFTSFGDYPLIRTHHFLTYALHSMTLVYPDVTPVRDWTDVQPYRSHLLDVLSFSVGLRSLMMVSEQKGEVSGFTPDDFDCIISHYAMAHGEKIHEQGYDDIAFMQSAQRLSAYVADHAEEAETPYDILYPVLAKTPSLIISQVREVPEEDIL